MPLPFSTGSLLPARAAPAPEPEPDPTLLEAVGASFRSAKDRTPFVQDTRLLEAYGPVVETLQDLRGDKSFFPYFDVTKAINPLGVDTYDYDAVWRDIDAARAKDPKAFSTLPKTRAEFETGVLTRQGATARDDRVAAAGGTLTTLAGAVPASFFDPLNTGAGLLTGGVSKGVPLVRGLLYQAVANAGTEAAEVPLTVRARQRVGDEVTVADVGTDIASAALFGMAFEGAGRVIDGGRGAFESSVAKHWDSIPAPLRQRWEKRATISTADGDVLLADMAEAIIGRDNMPEQLSDAALVLRREGQMDAANPFVPNGAGADMHPAMVGEAFDRLRQSLPGLPATRAADPTVVSNYAGSGRPFEEGKPIAAPSAYDAPGAQGRFMQKVRGAESGGSDTAKNPGSSATGRYQFIESTWLHYYKQRYGTGGLSDAQILAKRGNGALQDQLMSDLTADNSAFLRSVGEGVNEGNLYLVHFAGQGGARKLFDAEPGALVDDVLGAKVVNANPFLKGWTVDQTIRWAHNKMGVAVARGGVGSLRISDALARNEADRAAIQNALDDAIARHQAADFQRTQAAAAQSGLPMPAGDEAPVRIMQEGAPEIEAPRTEPVRQELPAEVQATLSPLRSMIETSKRNLNEFDAIAGDIGASPEEVRAGLRALVEEGRITRDKRGYRRKAWVQQRGDGGVSARLDDDELLETIAKAGGLRDDEGHALGLRGISARERRELLPQVQRRLREKRASGGSRDWQRMTRAHGPLLRHEGKSVDQIGELLWDEGWFRDRPTTAEVLDLIESRIQSGEKMYAPGRGPIAADEELHAPAPFAAEVAPARPAMLEAERADLARETQAMLDHVTGHSKWHGLREDDELLEEAAHIFNSGRAFNVTRDDALQIAMVEDIDRTIEMAYEEAGDDYGWREATPDELAELGFTDAPAAAAAGGGGRSAEPGGSRAGAEEPGSPGRPALADLTPEQRAPFLDPDGEAAKAQTDSLIHDARASLGEVDPNIADRQRQEAELGAQAPMRATEEQDGTMGLGLFDHADQPELRMELKGLLDSLDAEEAELKAIRDCL